MGRPPRSWNHYVRARPRAALAVVMAAVLAVAAALAAACGTDNRSATVDGSGAVSTAPSTSPTAPSTTELAGATTSPVSVPYPDTEQAQLVSVRVGSHDGYDRVVFELDGDLPGYDVGYLDGPPTQDGSGDPVEVDGDHVLSVRMTPVSGVVIGVDEVVQTYVGSDRIAGDGDPVNEVVRGGDFEAQSTWLIGVNGEHPFVVSTLSAPTRIVVDVATI